MFLSGASRGQQEILCRRSAHANARQLAGRFNPLIKVCAIAIFTGLHQVQVIQNCL
jgi:hypothetical protein